MQRLLASLTALAFGAHALAAQQARTRDQGSATLEARVDSIFAEHDRPDAPGCAVGVARDGIRLLAKGYGRASMESAAALSSRSAFNLGSVSKQFTAVAAFLLEERRRLSLDDDVRRFVPELPDYGDPIRIRDLLQHTSGLRDEGALASLADVRLRTMTEWLALLTRQRGLNFTPGSRHVYAHTDFTLLGLVVERAAGEPLGEFLRREVWLPRGMTSTVLHDGRGRPIPERAFAHTVAGGTFAIRFPEHALIGGDNVYTSVEDMLRWEIAADAAARGGPSHLTRLLERPRLASGETIPYAYGLRLGTYNGLRTVSRGGSGGGFGTDVLRFPDQRLSVVAFCNVLPAHPLHLARAVADFLLADQPRPVARSATTDTVPAPRAELERYIGVYASRTDRWNISRIVARDGALVEEFGTESYPLVRLGDGAYLSAGVRFTFDRAADGRVTLTLSDEERDEVLDRLEGALWAPTAPERSAYAGRFASGELDVVWELEAGPDGLTLRRPGDRRTLLQSISRDIFLAPYGSIEGLTPLALLFTRDADGRVDGFTVSAIPEEYEQARGVRFAR